ncbi:MAG: hypothetical protein ABEK12_04175, partial [Candidatus Nanohaloarchaea archaeon]
MQRTRAEIAAELSDRLGTEVSAQDIEIPEQDEYGDLAFPVMQVMADRDADARELAEDVADEVDLDIVDEVTVEGPGFL